MAYSAGEAFLQILPTFEGVAETVSAQAAEWGDRAAQAFNDVFKARVEAELADLPDARVDADTSEAEAKIGLLRAEIEALDEENFGLNVNDDEALAKIAALQAEITVLAAESPSIKVNVDGGGAATELAGIGAEAEGAGDGLDGMGSSASRASSSLPGLAAGLAVLATALIPIGGLALGALSTLPALIAGAASGLGALKLGLSGISGAISDFGKAQGAQPAVTGGNGNQAAIQAISDAEAERNATESVTNATRELADARTNASEQITADEKAVRDATVGGAQATQEAWDQIATDARSLASVRQESANQIRSAEEQLESSERSVTEAVYSEQQAQTALTQARQDASDQLKDYSDQLADASLQQRQNALAVQQAQANLASVQANPGSTPFQIAQAKLALDQANQAVQDQSDSYDQLKRKAADAAAAGVDGSSQVLDAQHSLADATQGVTDANQAQADAATNLSQVQVAAAQNIADAEQKLIDDSNAWIKSQTDGAASIRTAEEKLTADRIKNAENIADAQVAVKTALQDQEDTLKRISLELAGTGGGTTAQTPAEKYAADLAALTPAGRAFVEYVTGTIEPQIDSLKKKTQEALLPGLLQGLKDLEPVFQAAGPFITEAGTGIGTFITGLASLFASKGAINDLFGVNGLFATGDGFMQSLGGDVTTLIRAFLDIGSDAQPVVTTLESGIHSIVDDFARWVENGGFEKFLDWLRQNGPDIVGNLENMAKDFSKVVVALAPFGQAVLVDIKLFASAVEEILKLPQQIGDLQVKIGDAIHSVFDGSVKWVEDNVITPIVNLFGGIGDKITNVAKGMWDGIADAFVEALNFIIRGWDDLQFKTPSIDVFGVHTPSVTIGVPDVPPLKKIGAREDGGDVSAGLTYLVGEKGPELFTAPAAGHVTSAADLSGLLTSEARMPSRTGPLFGEVNLYDEADIDALMRQASFAVSARGL